MFPMYSRLLLIFLLYGPSLLFSLEPPPLLSTESDPDAFVHNCVQELPTRMMHSLVELSVASRPQGSFSIPIPTTPTIYKGSFF